MLYDQCAGTKDGAYDIKYFHQGKMYERNTGIDTGA
jgi:hypothetical protein